MYCDEVPTELSKQEERVLDIMHRISVVIWKTGEWPEEWTFSTFIPLPEKGDLKPVSYTHLTLPTILRV